MGDMQANLNRCGFNKVSLQDSILTLQLPSWSMMMKLIAASTFVLNSTEYLWMQDSKS